jgi:hypothetical protein
MVCIQIFGDAMKNLFHKLMVFIFVTSFTIICFAQESEDKPTVGLSTSVNREQLDILIPIWESDKFMIIPSIGFVSVQDLGKDYIFGLGSRIYFKRKKLSPFASSRFGLLIASPRDLDSTIDIIFGLGGGGEYFFDDHFSIGIEGQLNISISDENSTRFGNPGGTNLNTASTIFATIYF